MPMRRPSASSMTLKNYTKHVTLSLQLFEDQRRQSDDVHHRMGSPWQSQDLQPAAPGGGGSERHTLQDGRRCFGDRGRGAR